MAATLHRVRFVVQAAPAEGQQNCFAFEAVDPQTSTLPAELQRLSFGNSSPVEQSRSKLELFESGQAYPPKLHSFAFSEIF